MQPVFRSLLFISLLTLPACEENGTDSSETKQAKSAIAETADDSATGQASAAAVTMSALVKRPALVNLQGETTRGPMTWKAPMSWKEKDTSTKPFVIAEYYLPGNTESKPAMCRMSNGSEPKPGKDDEARARKRAGRVPLKTSEGDSLRKQVQIDARKLGNYRYALGEVDGYLYHDGTFIKPREPALIVKDYSAVTAVPVLPGPPYDIRCWGPRKTIEQQRSAISAWLSSIEVAPVAQEATADN